MPRLSLLAALALGLTACPSDKTETPTTETPATETPSTGTTPTEPPPATGTEADWTALLGALASQPAEPPALSTPDTQVYEGETVPLLYDPGTSTDASNGGIFAQKTGTTPLSFNEKWVSFDNNALLLQPVAGVSKTLKLQYVDGSPSAGVLTPARIATYCAMPGSSAFTLSNQNVAYFLFPTPASIAALPNTNPPNTTSTLTYEVWTSNQGQPAIRSGTMYMEIQTPPSGAPVWKPFWVFESDYVFPSPGVETQVKFVPTGGYTTLKSFLEAMQTLRNGESPANQAKWRYSPVNFSWTPLCTTP